MLDGGGGLQDLVEVDPDPREKMDYTWAWGATVTITLKDGSRFTSTVNAPVGSGARGIEWADVEAKYRALVPASGLSGSRIEESLKLIHDLERAKSISELTSLLLVSG